MLQHRPTLRHWGTMVSTTTKVTIRGGLPVRKLVLFLTTVFRKRYFLFSNLVCTRVRGCRCDSAFPIGPAAPTVPEDVNSSNDCWRWESRKFTVLTSTALVVSACSWATLRLKRLRGHWFHHLQLCLKQMT